MAKAKKSKARKSNAKKSKAKKTKKAKTRAAARGHAKKSNAKKTKVRKATRKPAKAKAKPAKKTVSKAAPKKKKQITGEGDYQASRRFLKDESNFVKRHLTEIPAMGKDAEAALEGPQGGELRAAEEAAKSHSKASGE